MPTTSSRSVENRAPANLDPPKPSARERAVSALYGAEVNRSSTWEVTLKRPQKCHQIALLLRRQAELQNKIKKFNRVFEC